MTQSNDEEFIKRLEEILKSRDKLDEFLIETNKGDYPIYDLIIKSYTGFITPAKMMINLLYNTNLEERNEIIGAKMPKDTAVIAFDQNKGLLLIYNNSNSILSNEEISSFVREKIVSKEGKISDETLRGGGQTFYTIMLGNEDKHEEVNNNLNNYLKDASRITKMILKNLLKQVHNYLKENELIINDFALCGLLNPKNEDIEKTVVNTCTKILVRTSKTH